ncbi:MAG TPA: DUF3823 domain-containing protein [Mucilaginibacter sp.]|nr:DUF3823 domain-containing protein [Mucilaginibacter sp.]
MTFAVIVTISSCVKKDNYAAPDQILKGTVIDNSTGQPLQAEQGSSSFQMRAYELSWNNGVGVTPENFNVHTDGTFENDKVFKGTYRIYPTDGAFVPIVFTDATGAAVDNGSKIINVTGGTTNVTFNVDPFLKVEWVGEPVVNADKTVTVQCRFTRGTNDPTRQFNVTDAYLFVNETAFVGNNSFNNLVSTQVNYSGTAGNALLGTTVTITSKVLPTDRNFYVRVGVRTADNVNKRYNYNVAKVVHIAP